MLEKNSVILELSEAIRNIPKSLGLIASVSGVVILGVIDYGTGSEFSFSIFYLAPISVATLLYGRNAGLLISFICAGVWITADLWGGAHYSSIVAPCWNTAVRFGYFTLHTVLLSVLLDAASKMRALALYDPLTGALNWRFFEESARREIERMRRSNKPVSLAYIDLDDFKKVNDSFGHDAGDHVLKMIVETIRKNIRPSDLLARTGGDEFVLLLPDTDRKSSELVFIRVRQAFSAEISARNYPVTMSIGVVTFTAVPSAIEDMLKLADELMYEVKREGKNSVRFKEWPRVHPEVTVHQERSQCHSSTRMGHGFFRQWPSWTTMREFKELHKGNSILFRKER